MVVIGSCVLGFYRFMRFCIFVGVFFVFNYLVKGLFVSIAGFQLFTGFYTDLFGFYNCALLVKHGI